jgi:pimeloyl-ACP methyl ester carboxylesterase
MMALQLLLINTFVLFPHASAETTKEAPTKHEALSTSAEQDGQTSRYVQIPLFYMTDRERGRPYFGAYRMNEQGHVYKVPCGKLDYTLENDHQNKITEREESLGWRAGTKPGKVPFSVHPFKIDNEDDVYDTFGQAISEAAKQSGRNEIFLLVHGFNNNFQIAAGKAARLAYNVQCPVVLYSWPSTGKLLQYNIDAGNNEWSQEHFNRLIEELISLKERTGLKINLVAHSMGNRLAVRSAPVAEGKRVFEQVFLVDPDFDAETFVHYVVRYVAHDSRRTSTANFRIFFSRKDRALPIAQLLFGGYTRLGQGADTVLETLFNPLELPNTLQNTADILGKLNPFAEDSSNSNDKDATDRWRNRFEWIDFTAIDHGLIGHTIPYELIASLWSTGKPGEGLAIVDAPTGQVNLITRFVARYFRQKSRIGDWGKCEKVVLTKDYPAPAAQAEVSPNQ